MAIDGRLEWREWQTNAGERRTAIVIVADSVQFLGGRDDATDGNDGHTPRAEDPIASPATTELGSEPSSGDDIPF